MRRFPLDALDSPAVGDRCADKECDDHECDEAYFIDCDPHGLVAVILSKA